MTNSKIYREDWVIEQTFDAIGSLCWLGTSTAHETSIREESERDLWEAIDEFLIECGDNEPHIEAIAGYFGHRYFESAGKAHAIVKALDDAGFEIVRKP